jgi:hypothetical protein
LDYRFLAFGIGWVRAQITGTPDCRNIYYFHLQVIKT